jgi:hypothetical protein
MKTALEYYEETRRLPEWGGSVSNYKSDDCANRALNKIRALLAKGAG